MGPLRLPTKTTIAILLFLIGVNLIARYPRTPHELGFDAFTFHGMTLSLIEHGRALWIIHPFSYFGLYPLSHPSGSLFMLGSITLLASVPIEGSVLLYDGIVVVVAVFASFACAIRRMATPPQFGDQYWIVFWTRRSNLFWSTMAIV